MRALDKEEWSKNKSSEEQLCITSEKAVLGKGKDVPFFNKKVTSSFFMHRAIVVFLLEVNEQNVNSAGVWRRDQIPLSLHIFDCGHLHRARMHRRRRPLPNLPASDTCSD